jgi:hypothetical protein
VPARQTKNTRAVYNRTAHRLREIEKIVRHRHGVVPDTDDADLYLGPVADCLLHIAWRKAGKPTPHDLFDRLNVWCERWAPDVSVKLQWDVVRDALRSPRNDRADECAKRLRLSYAERTKLRITTIGAYDVPKSDRTALRKVRKRLADRERAAMKRAQRGAVTRTEYLAKSLSRIRPWAEEGISRRSWERRRRKRTQPVLGELDASASYSNLPYCLATDLRHQSPGD